MSINSAISSIWSWWWSFISENDTNLRANFSILFLTFSMLIWLIWASMKTRNPSPPLPPGPLGLPILGYLPFLGTNLHHTFTDLARVYGPIYKFQLGVKLCIVINSPEMVKEVIRDQDSTFVYREAPRAAIAPLYGPSNIAMGQYGPGWKKLRKILVRDMLTGASLETSFHLSREEVRKCIAKVFDKTGNPIDVGELGFSMTINSIMSMLWGGRQGGEKLGEKGVDTRTKFRQAIANFMVLMGKLNISDLFPLLARFDIQGIERQSKKVAEVYDMIFSDAIEQEKNMACIVGENGKESKGFLRFLLDLKENEDSEESITPNQFKGLVMDVIVAGTDTTTTTIEWVMAELMKNPEAMKKVQDELNDIVGLNNWVEDFHLPNLRYLSAAIKEAMRIHPPLPFLIPRFPCQSCIVGGYTIPKGSEVFLNMWAIQRDPKFWDNPLEFRPERFLDESKKFDFSGNNFVYLPFGSGRRICAGAVLGERMLMYALSMMLHSFEWKLPHGVELDLEERYGIVVKKLKPLVAIPTARLPKLGLVGPNDNM